MFQRDHVGGRRPLLDLEHFVRRRGRIDSRHAVRLEAAAHHVQRIADDRRGEAMALSLLKTPKAKEIMEFSWHLEF
jgi:hypothetical protein